MDKRRMEFIQTYKMAGFYKEGENLVGMKR
jgi:hypothetical protein